jgi:Zn-dependent peptidase ImmA (M78 family)
MAIKAPYLPYEKIESIAQEFLQHFHSEFTLPIPIEYIIEYGLNLHIFPLENLYKHFKLNGFLSSDRTTIVIDGYQYDNYVEKYRFTLAHEVGHYIMHEEFYQGLEFKSVEEYYNFLLSIPIDELRWFETQGDNFAGHILVPTKQLEEECEKLIQDNNHRFIDNYQPASDFWSYASEKLAESFDVNPKVVEIRINKQCLGYKFDHYFKKDS